MFRLSLFALACVVVLTGCGESLEGNPLFKEQQKTVARLDTETKSMGRQFEDVAITVSNLRQQVREIRNDPSFVPASNGASGGDDPHAMLRDLQARVAALEAQLGKSKSGANLASASGSGSSSGSTTTKSSPSSDSSSSASSNDAPKSSASSSSEPPASSSEPRQTVRVSTRAAEPARAVSVSLADSDDGDSEDRADSRIEVASAVAKSAPAAAPKPAPRQEARSSGAYYQVRDGDTPATVAREHGISIEKLSGANGIPSGRSWRLMPGQRIFVPKG